MRIVVHGQQAFGKAVLEALLERGEEIVGVYCAPDREGRPVDPLKAFAEEKGLPVSQPASWKKPEVWEALKAQQPDLCVMAYVTLLVPRTALDIPTHGTIQYHPSLLPKHRGPSSINWPIIQGETETGLTIFWPDEKLDEGPILLQKKVPIGPDDTLGSLYFDHLFPMGVAAMCEAVDMVRDGTAPRVEQDHSQATYESWCTREEVEIDWSSPVAHVYNLIRGTNPQPGAWTRHDGRVLQVFDSASRRFDHASDPGVGAHPGEIISVDGEGFAVAAEGGTILVKRVCPEGGDKVPAGEYAETAGLRTGDRLG
jgi:methionyl-tRNA formyltransferase